MNNVYTRGQILNLTEGPGIWLDYKDGTWLFMVKDDIWTPEEIKNAWHRELTLRFIQKDIVDAFLLEIDDCLESSDLPFCVKDADEELLASLADDNAYDYAVVLVNGQNEVVVARQRPLGAENSRLLKEKLQERLQQDFTSAMAEEAYQKLSEEYEPFEIEPFTVFVGKDTK